MTSTCTQPIMKVCAHAHTHTHFDLNGWPLLGVMPLSAPKGRHSWSTQPGPHCPYLKTQLGSSQFNPDLPESSIQASNNSSSCQGVAITTCRLTDANIKAPLAWVYSIPAIQYVHPTGSHVKRPHLPPVTVLSFYANHCSTRYNGTLFLTIFIFRCCYQTDSDCKLGLCSSCLITALVNNECNRAVVS